MPENFIEQLRDKMAEQATHIGVMNAEMGELRDRVAEVCTAMDSLKDDFIETRTDVKWLKKNHWIVAGAAGGGLIAGVLNLLFK